VFPLVFMSKADYLKKYLSNDDGKKKKKTHTSSKSRGGLRIIEDDDLLLPGPSVEAIEDAWDRQGQDDQPVTVELSNASENKARGSWVPIEEKVSSKRHRAEADASPPRRRPTAADASPPRRRPAVEDASPPRRRPAVEDASPPRRRPAAEDASPPRRGNETGARSEGSNQLRDANGRRTTTASGHNAGLQTFQSFGQKERELQEKKEKELREFGATLPSALSLA
jgi:hypothetical protein